MTTSQRYQNLDVIIGIFDFDQDGFLTVADFRAHAEHTCGALHLAEGSPHWTTIHTALDSWWRHLLDNANDPAGNAGEERVPTPECVTIMADKLVDDPDFFGSAITPIAETVFHVLDGDGDDTISVGEYIAVYLASGLTERIAIDAFARIDTNNDGRIDIGEFVDVVKDAFTSNDPDSPGAFFFGAQPTGAK